VAVRPALALVGHRGSRHRVLDLVQLDQRLVHQVQLSVGDQARRSEVARPDDANERIHVGDRRGAPARIAIEQVTLGMQEPAASMRRRRRSRSSLSILSGGPGQLC